MVVSWLLGPLLLCGKLKIELANQLLWAVDDCVQRTAARERSLPVLDVRESCAPISPAGTGSNSLSGFMRDHDFRLASHTHVFPVGQLLARKTDDSAASIFSPGAPCIMMSLREPAKRFESGFRRIERDNLTLGMSMDQFVDAALNLSHPLHRCVAPRLHLGQRGVPLVGYLADSGERADYPTSIDATESHYQKHVGCNSGSVADVETLYNMRPQEADAQFGVLQHARHLARHPPPKPSDTAPQLLR